MESDRRVDQPEIDEILATGPIYNGMISIELRKRYGERLYHVSGDGWYVKATGKCCWECDDSCTPENCCHLQGGAA